VRTDLRKGAGSVTANWMTKRQAAEATKAWKFYYYYYIQWSILNIWGVLFRVMLSWNDIRYSWAGIFVNEWWEAIVGNEGRFKMSLASKI
jgi:hypothetical protein